MTGRLQGTCAGRPVEIVAEGRELLLRVPNLRTAWALRRGAVSPLAHLLRSFCLQGLSVRVQVGSFSPVALVPDPHWSVRLLVPALRRTTDE
jgi:hypothetical protein